LRGASISKIIPARPSRFEQHWEIGFQVTERRLARILGEKDPAEFGPRIKRKLEATRLLADLEKFAAWAELELTRAH
jgi:hypothetical protein